MAIDAGKVVDATAPTDAFVNGPGLDPAIATIVASVDTTRVNATINKLANFTTRNTCSNDTSNGGAIGSARDWVKAQYQAIPGLTVSLDDFTYGGCAAGTVTDQNVVAVKLGTHPDRVIVIGGHIRARLYRPIPRARRRALTTRDPKAPLCSRPHVSWPASPSTRR
jgi:hypothetical protein